LIDGNAQIIRKPEKNRLCHRYYLRDKTNNWPCYSNGSKDKKGKTFDPTTQIIGWRR
jgi:hypothetical protein